MGTVRVLPNDLLDVLKEHSPILKKDCARRLKCGLSTVERKRRILTRDGCDIIWNQNGYTLMEKQDVTQDNADDAIEFQRLLTRVALAAAQAMESHQAVGKAAYKLIADGMTREERRKLRSIFTLGIRFIDAKDIDDDFGE